MIKLSVSIRIVSTIFNKRILSINISRVIRLYVIYSFKKKLHNFFFNLLILDGFNKYDVAKIFGEKEPIMKLEKIAKKAIDIIRSAGVEGVSTSSLSKELQVPKRRIYDVKAIMKAAGLIETRRDKTGTTIYWKDKNMTPELNVNTIESKKIKIYTDGLITRVSNSSNEVIIEGTSDEMNIEAI